jgi:transposase
MTARQISEILDYVRNGHSAMEASHKFNISLGHTYLILRRNKIKLNGYAKEVSQQTNEIIEILRDENIGMKEISKRFGVTYQRVSQIYKKAIKDGKELPERKPGFPERMKGRTYHHKKCIICKRKFKTLIKKQKACSPKCGHVRDGNIDWPKNLEELVRKGPSMQSVAAQLGVYPQAIRRKLIRDGWTKEMFWEIDGRRSRKSDRESPHA